MGLRITWKEFLRATVLGAVGLSFIPPFSAVAADKPGVTAIYKLRPLEGKKYSPAFVKFCERASFPSVKQALRSAYKRGVECSLYRTKTV